MYTIDGLCTFSGCPAIVACVNTKTSMCGLKIKESVLGMATSISGTSLSSPLHQEVKYCHTDTTKFLIRKGVVPRILSMIIEFVCLCIKQVFMRVY